MKAPRVLLALLWCASLSGAELPKWGAFVETNFPFMSSVVDARKASPNGPTNNLVPRGLILNVAGDVRVCFDVDLLRVAAVWRGPGVTPVSMAQGSYENENWGKKAPEGQALLPRIVGEPILLTEPLSAFHESNPGAADPRLAGPDANEIGRGPLPAEFGRMSAIDFGTNGPALEYSLRGENVRERFYVAEGTLFRERIQAGLRGTMRVAVVTNAPDTKPLIGKRWPEELVTGVDGVTTNDVYRIENIALPVENPWRRNVRIADIAFFKNGRAAAVTFDGDVWLIEGLNGDLREIRWRRFTSGLHEPLSVVIRDEEIFVFDRNGIWKVVDADNNGEADRHEMFCNDFSQTAETREFASSMELLPDGGFVIGKPGQSGSTVGRDSGKVLKISADGKTVTAIGHGFRQPFLGVNPRTGVVTSSDQQGNYIPTTPLHVVRENQYYGFRPVILARETEAPDVAEPLVRIPHAVNASGAGQVWLSERFGPLGNTLLHIGYYRSELFNVLWDGGDNAAVVSFTRDLKFPALNGTIHPVDGSLFVAGFQIWGGMSEQVSGIARVTHVGGESALPRSVVPMREGVLISFHTAVDAASVRPENFSADRWNYRRSHEYGSPHFRLDGTKGQEVMFASSTYVSGDAKAVFVGFPDMQPVMQMRVGWTLAAKSGAALRRNAYMSPRNLQSFAPSKHGFAEVKVDLTPRTNNVATEATPVTVEEGKRLAELMGCLACHSLDGSSLGKIGPTWKGAAGRRVQLKDGATVLADSEYLRESIRNPGAKIVKDFDKSDAGMPSYEGVLTDAQIEGLVVYIESLR